MKMQKYVIVVKKKWSIKSIVIVTVIESIVCQILIVFHNGSDYDYHFIIKELAEKFKKHFPWLGKNTKKHIKFTVPIKKEV